MTTSGLRSAWLLIAVAVRMLAGISAEAREDTFAVAIGAKNDLLEGTGSGYQCDGDADGATETFLEYRVFGNDLALVVANWKKTIDDPALNPCADIDHQAETIFKYRVYGRDLNIVVTNWKKKDAELKGDCPRPE